MGDETLLDVQYAAGERTMPVYKFVLTGGPCAGKTTALGRMATFFREKGFRVYTVQETATCLFTNGVKLEHLEKPSSKFTFQWSVLSLQMEVEDCFERIARDSGEPCILFCDRGLMDGSVYMDSKGWDRMVASRAMNEVSLRDGRYDGIFHMVTAACGAEDHYSLDSNEARSEPLQLAKEVDEKTQAAWLGHPRHLIFDNSTGLDDKIERMTAAATRLLGSPCRPRRDCKFLLKQAPPPIDEFPVSVMEFEIEKVSLRRQGRGGAQELSSSEVEGDRSAVVSSESFLVKRGRHDLFTYRMMTVSSREDGTVTEVSRTLGEADYKAIEADRGDPARPRVRQRHLLFLWERQVFEIHVDVEPAYGVSVLYRHAEGELVVEEIRGGHVAAVLVSWCRKQVTRK